MGMWTRAIEAGARALAKHSHVTNDDRWEEPTTIPGLADSIRDKWRADARAVLNAALADAMLKVEWGYRYRGWGREWTKTIACQNKADAERQVTEFYEAFPKGPGVQAEVRQRLIITTPWEEARDGVLPADGDG